VYKKDTGKTIVEEINGLRLTWARGELKNNPSSVTRMALEAGFNSPEHFQRLYKKKFGVTPGRDRG
jgi:2-isopropylmalate synthase